MKMSNNENELNRALLKFHAGMLYAGLDACIHCGRDGNQGCSEYPGGCLVYNVTKTVVPDFKAPCELIEGWPGSLEYLGDMIESTAEALKKKRGTAKPDDGRTLEDWIRGEQE